MLTDPMVYMVLQNLPSYYYYDIYTSTRDRGVTGLVRELQEYL